MSKAAKIWLIVAASLVLVGSMIFVGAMAAIEWDIKKLATDKYQTNVHKITEDISSISVDTNTADIKFVASEDAGCSVECYEQKNLNHSVEVKDGTLVIEVVDTRKWYEHVGINFDSPKVTVYLPQGEYNELSVSSATGDVEVSKEFVFESIDISEDTGDVINYARALKTIEIETDTGDIYVKDTSAGSLDLSVATGDVSVFGVTCEGEISIEVSTGKARLTNVSCKSVISSGDTGDISLNNVIASERFCIERSTGDVRFDGSDAPEIFIETDTGDVEGSLLTDKVFITKTDTGNINVPSSVTGGRCEITTDTGDIRISVK